MRITEIKRHLDGRVQAFECDLVYAAPSLRVVRFQHPAETRLAGFHFPPGSYTFGFFWRARHYGLYRIMGPDGRLIAHRFDVIDAVRLRQASVEYLDLALDLWVSPQGRLVVEDAEEVSLYVRRGVLSLERALLVERTRRLLERRHRAIMAEAARLLQPR
jgi:predicted RNA-binding protein associated with RNAse of E/G family